MDGWMKQLVPVVYILWPARLFLLLVVSGGYVLSRRGYRYVLRRGSLVLLDTHNDRTRRKDPFGPTGSTKPWFFFTAFDLSTL
jgi:hypothetical protein